MLKTTIVLLSLAYAAAAAADAESRNLQTTSLVYTRFPTPSNVLLDPITTYSPVSKPSTTQYPSSRAPSRKPTRQPTNFPTRKPSSKPPTRPASGNAVFATSAPSIPIKTTRYPTAQRSIARPNIVIALADDLGYGDVGFTDRGMNLAKTPNLDAMAASTGSWVLNNMHSEAACSPSRISILTARAPLRNCVLGSQIDGQTSYNTGTQTIVHLATKLNYRTLFLGKFLPHSTNLNAETDRPSQLGFQNWTTIEGGSTYDFACICREEDLTKCFLGHETVKNFMQYRALCFAQSSPNGREDYPPRFAMESLFLADRFHAWLGNEVRVEESFFAQISFRSVHVPFVASPELRDACERDEICNPTALPKTSLQLDYAGCVFAIDQAIGRMRDSIRALRPHDYDNTLFIFMSDNGPARATASAPGAGSTGGYRGGKNSILFEGSLLVPTVMEWPRAIRSRKTINTVLSIVDIPTTIAEAISGKRYTQTDGMSLLPHIIAGTAVFSRTGYFAVCSFTDAASVKKGLACTSIALYDSTGKWKLLADRVNDVRLGTAPASQVKESSAVLYNLQDGLYEAKQSSNGPKARMIAQANDWLKDIFTSFRDNCNLYYSSG